MLRPPKAAVALHVQQTESAMGQCTVLLFVVITSQKEKEK